MSGYTLHSLLDVDDVAAGRAPGLEARMARSVMDSEHLGVSYFRLDPGVRAPYGHHHRVQEEIYVVVPGSGRFKVDDELVEVKRWDALRIAPEAVRAMEAGPDGLELIVVGSDRPEEGDGEIARPT